MMRVESSQPGAPALASLLANAEKASARQGGGFAALLQQGTQGRARAAAVVTAPPAGSAQLFPEPTRAVAPAAVAPAAVAPVAAPTPVPARATAPVEAADRKATPKHEKTKPVEGRKYEEIVAGPRNGMFLNRSGNERDGMAFLRVTRNHREFHVYGSGEDRLIVEVRHKPKGAAAPAPAAATPAPATAPSTTPTTSAPSAATPATPVAAPGGLGDVPQDAPSARR